MELPQRLKKMLNRLPVDTETLVVANGPFEFPDSSKENPSVDEMLSSLSLGLPSSEVLLNHLKGQQIEIAIEGSRRFRSPSGLGMMPYEGCHLIQFKESSEDVLKQVMKACLERSEESLQLHNHPVAVLKERLEQDDWTFYLTHPQPGLLLCATHRGYLEEVLQKMEKVPETRAFPASLPEWKHVDFNARVWAIRHYRKESAQQDPSSPLRERAAANTPDPDAKGLVFSFDHKQKVARVLYLSTADNAVGLVTEGWHHPSEGLSPKIKLTQPGIVEVSERFGNDGDGGMFVLVLLGYLGHAVYL